MKRNRNSDDLSDAKEDAEFSRTDDKIDRGIVFCVASHQLWIVLTCGQCSTVEYFVIRVWKMSIGFSRFNQFSMCDNMIHKATHFFFRETEF